MVQACQVSCLLQPPHRNRRIDELWAGYNQITHPTVSGSKSKERCINPSEENEKPLWRDITDRLIHWEILCVHWWKDSRLWGGPFFQIIRVDAIPIKIPFYLVELDKLILTFILKCKESRIAKLSQESWRKRTESFPTDIRSSFKATVTEMMWCWDWVWPEGHVRKVALQWGRTDV